MDPVKPSDFARGEAHLGKSLLIKGELSGSEDLYLDGQVEGTIDLKGNRLTVGPNGKIKANVNARSVVVHGKLEGNITASDRVDLKHSAVVTGDITTQRISIDEGAYFKGGVDIHRDAPKQEVVGAKPEVTPASTPAAAGASVSATGARPAPIAALDPRK